MPYIENNKRPDMDEVVQLMADKGVVANGDLNYILYAFCKRHIEKKYNSLKNYCGELNECVTEIRRRLMSEREDEAIKENGDILCHFQKI